MGGVCCGAKIADGEPLSRTPSTDVITADEDLTQQQHLASLETLDSEKAISDALKQVVELLDAELDAKKVNLQASGRDDLSGYTILSKVSVEQKHLLVQSAKAFAKFDRAMGSICGMAIGDATGGPLEFISAEDVPGASGSFFDLQTMQFHGEFNKFQLERGQWTDDAAMGLCVADSLIMRRSFDGADMRIRFWCWWFRAYNNAFRLDKTRKRKGSVGLGGNVRKSLEELSASRGDVSPLFQEKNEDAGNGSLMRLAPLPVFLHAAPPSELYNIARLHSRTTHPGNIAAEACAFLSHLIRRAITAPPGPIDVRAFLEHEAKEFRTLSGLVEKEGFGWDELNWLVTSSPVRDTELCWNWRADNLNVVASLRARGWSYNGYPVSSDYFGSYSLDGLAVALWCVYHTTSFDEAVARSVNFLGDADSHGSITGQLAGALYGYSSIHQHFLDVLAKWDQHDFAVHALLLQHLGQPSGGAAP